MGAAAGLRAGMEMGDRIVAAYRAGAINRGIAANEDATVQNNSAYTPEQGEWLAAAQKAGYDVTAGPGGLYQVGKGTAQNAGTELSGGPLTVDHGNQSYALLGQNFNAMPTAAQQRRARDEANIGVYRRYGENDKAIEMQRQMLADDRANEEFGMRKEMQSAQLAGLKRQGELTDLHIADAQRTAATAKRMDGFNAEFAALQQANPGADVGTQLRAAGALAAKHGLDGTQTMAVGASILGMSEQQLKGDTMARLSLLGKSKSLAGDIDLFNSNPLFGDATKITTKQGKHGVVLYRDGQPMAGGAQLSEEAARAYLREQLENPANAVRFAFDVQTHQSKMATEEANRAESGARLGLIGAQTRAASANARESDAKAGYYRTGGAKGAAGSGGLTAPQVSLRNGLVSQMNNLELAMQNAADDQAKLRELGAQYKAAKDQLARIDAGLIPGGPQGPAPSRQDLIDTYAVADPETKKALAALNPWLVAPARQSAAPAPEGDGRDPRTGRPLAPYPGSGRRILPLIQQRELDRLRKAMVAATGTVKFAAARAAYIEYRQRVGG